MTTLAQLIKDSARQAFFDFALGTMNALGVQVTSWQKDDPTRALTYAQSIRNEAFSSWIGGAVLAGFLDYAPDDTPVIGGETWLTLVARYVYGEERIKATRAELPIVLTNTQGGSFNFNVGMVTVKVPGGDVTYTNVTAGRLAPGPGTTRTLTFRANTPGAIGSASATTITEMVTSFPGVTSSNVVAAVGHDEEPRLALIDRCRSKLAALSPNGPAAAVRYVALTPKYNGGVAVTRVTLVPDSTTGQGTIYLAGESGTVSGPDRALVEAGILRYATPICFSPVVLAATPVVVSVTQTVYVYDDVNIEDADLIAAFAKALDVAIFERPIGGDHQPPSAQGWLYKSVLESAPFRATYAANDGDTPLRLAPYVFRAATGTPAGDTMLDPDECPIPGVHTISITRVPRDQ